MKQSRLIWIQLAIVAAASTLLFGGCSQDSATASVNVEQIGLVRTLPDFTSYRDVKEKKKAFFNFLRPIIENENSKVRAQRQQMLQIREHLDSGKFLSVNDTAWLQALATEYNVELPNVNDEVAWKLLRRRVDTVPFRLALAQAANESSWGTSRFAREGFNLFGQW